VAGARLRWREWDDEFILFHEQSGNIHHLNLFGATALKNLLAAPASIDSLAEQTASQLDINCDQVMVDGVRELVSQLKALGIVQADEP